MSAINMLAEFLEDDKAWEMFITGRAGTGKTTTLAEVTQYLIDNDISYVICAFTHKACKVLESKLPANANIMTLHKYLKKRPGVNEHATKVQHVNINSKMGDSERPRIVIIDEYSMIGERDYLDLLDMQDPHDEGATEFIKTLYVGDPYQLPPVGDMQTIVPKKPYWIELKHVYRTEHNDLLDIMTKLVSMIDGADLEPLEASENFIRGQNLIEAYKASESTDKVCLAWTNQAVQALNIAIANKTAPNKGDLLWSPTVRAELEFLGIAKEEPLMIHTPTVPVLKGSKYKTLEYLFQLSEVTFMHFNNITVDETQTYAVIFGHYNYKQILQDLTDKAVECNRKIQRITSESPAQWARINKDNPLAKERAQAWRKLLAIKNTVICVDFPYAMTIHKSQGSTYEEVYLDSEDLAKCGAINTDMYLKLFYVAVSRASKKVVTS